MKKQMMNDTNSNAIKASHEKEFRQKFIQDNENLILSIASKTTGRYITKSDDEYSVALIAFNEAIDAYDEDKGSFNSFASLVIKRRLSDEYRRKKDEISVNPTSFEKYSDSDSATGVDDGVSAKMNELAIEEDEKAKRIEAIRLEIEEATQIVSVYGFTFFELTDCSPKSERTKKACKEAIICLLRPGELYDEMVKSKLLPIKELEKRTGIKRKTLERHRKYIMAVSELLHGDFPHLGEYLSDIRRGL